jgi:hypothetical protein
LTARLSVRGRFTTEVPWRARSAASTLGRAVPLPDLVHETAHAAFQGPGNRPVDLQVIAIGIADLPRLPAGTNARR